jgi:hypothetical protein
MYPQWASANSENLVFQKDYIHDFNLGSLTLSSRILGEEFTYEGSYLQKSTSPYVQSLLTLTLYNPWFVLMTKGMDPTLAENKFVNYNNSTGGVLTRPGYNFSGSSQLVATRFNKNDSLLGPYSYTVTQAGTQQLTFYLYFIAGQSTASTSTSDDGIHGLYMENSEWTNTNVAKYAPFFKPEIAISTGWLKKSWFRQFSFNVFQKAVAITRGGNNNIINDGTIINAIVNNEVTLNRNSNRGVSTSSWTIEKVNGATITTAVQGTDYTFITGSLTTSPIKIKFLTTGSLKVTNNVTGNSSTSTGANTDKTSVTYRVGQVVKDDISLPQVTPVVSGVVQYGNVILATSPLKGQTPFTITVNYTLNKNNASWVNTTNGVVNNITNSVTDPQWASAISENCAIFCRVIKNNTVIASKGGFGPHTFQLTEGVYSVGYVLIPKIRDVAELATFQPAQT